MEKFTDMNILKLTLKKQWFEMIASGEKTQEYRQIKRYWFDRLVWDPQKVAYFLGLKNDYTDADVLKVLVPQKVLFAFKPFDAVEFTNGYGKHRPRITLKIKSIEINTGVTQWGAEDPFTDYFIINLGEEISRANF